MFTGNGMYDVPPYVTLYCKSEIKSPRMSANLIGKFVGHERPKPPSVGLSAAFGG